MKKDNRILLVTFVCLAGLLGIDIYRYGFWVGAGRFFVTIVVGLLALYLLTSWIDKGE